MRIVSIQGSNSCMSRDREHFLARLVWRESFDMDGAVLPGWATGILDRMIINLTLVVWG